MSTAIFHAPVKSKGEETLQKIMQIPNLFSAFFQNLIQKFQNNNKK
jgi:hypothetical protein